MTILEELEKNGVWVVTILNLDRIEKSEIEEILNGEEREKHEFKTKEEAITFQEEMNSRGLFSNICRTLRF